MTTLASFPLDQQGKALAEGLRSPAQRFVLNQGDTFLIANALGDLHANEDGLFHNDTRVLSHLVLEIGGKTPWFLGAAISRDDVFFTANLTNSPLPPLGGTQAPALERPNP
jgi:hypothetical protein